MARNRTRRFGHQNGTKTPRPEAPSGLATARASSDVGNDGAASGGGAAVPPEAAAAGGRDRLVGGTSRRRRSQGGVSGGRRRSPKAAPAAEALGGEQWIQSLVALVARGRATRIPPPHLPSRAAASDGSLGVGLIYECDGLPLHPRRRRI